MEGGGGGGEGGEGARVVEVKAVATEVAMALGVREVAVKAAVEMVAEVLEEEGRAAAEAVDAVEVMAMVVAAAMAITVEMLADWERMVATEGGLGRAGVVAAVMEEVVRTASHRHRDGRACFRRIQCTPTPDC